MRIRLRLFLLAAAVLWAVAAGWTVADAVRALRGAEAAVEEAQDRFGPEGVREGRLAEPLRAAAAQFERARARLDSPVIAPVRLLPVVGRHLAAVRDLAGAGHGVTTTGARTAETMEDILAQNGRNGRTRLAMLARAEAALRRAEAELEAVDPGTGAALVGPVRQRYVRFSRELDRAHSAVARAEDAARAFRSLLAGPRTYLLLGGHNGEMRAGSGAFLSLGVLGTGAGHIELESTHAAGDMVLDSGVAIAGDVADLWGWMEPNRDFRNLGITPRFPVTAELAARMWEARTGTRVDGVLAIDIEALGGLVAATRPVRLEEGELGASEVVPFLLRGQYVDFDPDLSGAQAQRRERLGDIAAAALAAVDEGDYDTARLAWTLAEAVSGRHVLAWAQGAVEQEGWEAAGAAGEVGADSLLAAVVNRGANKLDPFLDVSARLEAGRRGRRTLHVTIVNRAPEGLPRYVTGVEPDVDLPPGDYRGLLSVTLPGASAGASINGDRMTAVAARGRDGPTRVVAVEFEVRRGMEAEFRVTFVMPDAASLVVLPDARISPARWRACGRQWRAREARILGETCRE